MIHYNNILFTFLFSMIFSILCFAQKASFQGLGDLPGGTFESAAQRVSANGLVVVGYGTTAAGQQAFRWTQKEGMVSLGNLSDNRFKQSVALGVSADGSVIVGNGDTSSNAG
jgi:probable HAF family extracellular repeat protein